MEVTGAISNGIDFVIPAAEPMEANVYVSGAFWDNGIVCDPSGNWVFRLKVCLWLQQDRFDGGLPEGFCLLGGDEEGYKLDYP